MEKIIETFEKLLDTSPKKIEKKKDQIIPFEVSRDESAIKGLSFGLPNDHTDKLVTVFSRLALFFEAGVFLENLDGEWKSMAYFHEGQLQALLQSESQLVNIPNPILFDMLSCKAEKMLSILNLTHLDKEFKLSCLLIKPSNDCAYLLFSKLPDIWLKDHAEKIARAIQNSFA